MLQLEPGMMIWTWATFIVLFLILLKVAWKPLLSAVEEREKTISDSLRRAEEARTEAQQVLEQHQKMIADAQEEIQKMLQQNKQVAEKIKAEMLQKAREESERLRQRAEADIAREKEAAIVELRSQVADIAIQVASRLIRENLDARKHKGLIDAYIKELDNLEKN